MGRKGGVKEKFSFRGICGEKSEKGGISAYGDYAAGLPGGCCVDSASSAILQRSSSRTQWPSGPAMTPLRLHC